MSNETPVLVATAATAQPETADRLRSGEEVTRLGADEIAKVLGDPRDHAQMKVLSSLRVSCWAAALD